MDRFLIWFYCLDLWTASVLLLAATAAAAVVSLRMPRRALLRALAALVLAVWGIAVFHLTVGSRTAGEAAVACWIPLQSYRLVRSGHSPELLRSNYMNVLLFYPAGVLLGIVWAPVRRHRAAAGLCVVCLGLFSLWIELTQYRLHLGLAEADDVLHNTLGALAGLVSFGLLLRYCAPHLLALPGRLRAWLRE